MPHKSRVDNFEGPDSEYIAYLELKVTQLQRLAISQPADVAQPIYCPPSPPSDHRSDIVESTDTNQPPADQLQFIPYVPVSDFFDDSSSPRLGKRKRESIPRWQRNMDNMLRTIPDSHDWSPLRNGVGLSSSAEILVGYDMIIYGATVEEVGRTVASQHSCDPPLAFASNYARRTAALEVEGRFATQIVHFRKLILVSLCCVMLSHGVDKTLIDGILEVYISKSESKNLEALRYGARWVNRMIDALGSKLHHRATELFVLCKKSWS